MLFVIARTTDDSTAREDMKITTATRASTSVKPESVRAQPSALERAAHDAHSGTSLSSFVRVPDGSRSVLTVYLQTPLAHRTPPRGVHVTSTVTRYINVFGKELSEPQTRLPAGIQHAATVIVAT